MTTNTSGKTKFSDRHPVLSLLLFTYGAYFLAQYLIGISIAFILNGLMGLDTTTATTTGAVIGSLIVLALWYKRCSPEFRINSGKGSFTGAIRLLAPIAILWVMLIVMYSAAAGKIPFTVLNIPTLMSCLMAGLSEEIIFREIAISHMTKYFRSEKMIPIIAAVSGLLFGLTHFLNAVGGGTLLGRVFQVVLSICFGYFFSAVYLRKGNIWALIVMHTLYDVIVLSLGNGLTNAGISELPNWISTMIFILEAALGVYGFYLLRKEKRNEIIRFWDYKWSRETTGEAAEDN